MENNGMTVTASDADHSVTFQMTDIESGEIVYATLDNNDTVLMRDGAMKKYDTAVNVQYMVLIDYQTAMNAIMDVLNI